jgi:hypothetical protein
MSTERGWPQVDYSADDTTERFLDPYLFWEAPWTDVAVRAGGQIVAWERLHDDGSVETVPASGVIYERRGPVGSVLKAPLD